MNRGTAIVIRTAATPAHMWDVARRLRTDPPPALHDLLGEGTAGGWVPRDPDAPAVPESLPSHRHRLHLPPAFRVTFVDGAVVAVARQRVGVVAWASAAYRRQFFDAVAELNQLLAASECRITDADHPVARSVRHGKPLDEVLESLSPWEGEVPGLIDLDVPAPRDTGYCHFSEGVDEPFPRPWPPWPLRETPAEPTPPADPDEVNLLAGRLSSDDRMVKYRALRRLLEIGPGAAGAKPALIRVAEEPDGPFRGAASMVLADLADDPGRAYADLLRRFGDTPKLRRDIVARLARIGRRVRGVASAVAGRFDDEADPVWREEMSRTVWRIGADHESIPALRKVLTGEGDWDRKFWAARALATLGDQAGSVAGDLIDSCVSPDPTPQKMPMRNFAAVAWALRIIGLETSIGVVERIRATADAEECRRAVILLGAMRVPGAEETLAGLLRHADGSVRWAAAEVLAQAGRPAPELVEFLVGEIPAGDAAAAVGLLGAAGATEALPAIRAAAARPHSTVEPSARRAIRRLERLAGSPLVSEPIGG